MTAYSDIERTEIYSSSRISEISTSTAASTRSRASKSRYDNLILILIFSSGKHFRSKKNKPRRKPRKRSEVFPTSSSGSGGKRPNMTTYDPIMEVSFRVDDEDEDETDLLVNIRVKS